MIRSRILTRLITIGLPLVLLTARPVSAHDNGRDHWDRNVYHDYTHWGRVDREYRPSWFGTYEVDRYYRYPENRANWGYSRYGDRDFDCDRGYSGSRYYGYSRPSYYYGGGWRGSEHNHRAWWRW